MAKTAKKIIELYVVVNDSDNVLSYENSLDMAKAYVEEAGINPAKILKVTQMWEAYYPEDPDMIFIESSLGDL